MRTISDTVSGLPAWTRLAPSLRRLLWQCGPIVGLILVLAIFAFASPRFLTAGNMANILRQTAFTALIAVGQTLVILTGGIDLSVGAVSAIAGSISAVLMTQGLSIGGLTIPPLDWALGLFVALFVGAFVGATNGLIITKGRIPDFIATLGTLTAVRGLALLVTGGLPVPSHFALRGVARGYLPETMVWIGTTNVLGIPLFGIIAIFVGILVWLMLRYTALGRSLYAVGGNREAARVSGISVDRSKLAAYLLSGLIAGLAGYLLAARMNSANALMGDAEELRSIASVVIGGTNLFGGEGGVFGSLIGAFIMGSLGNGLNMVHVSAFWQRVIQGAVIVLVVVFDQWRRRRFRTS